jgi:hypothetical protein
MDRQRVHISAESYGTPALAATMYHTDHAGTREASDDLINTEASQLCLHHVARARLLKPEFGICVKIATQLGHFLMETGDLADDGHVRLLKLSHRRLCVARYGGRERRLKPSKHACAEEACKPGEKWAKLWLNPVRDRDRCGRRWANGRDSVGRGFQV